MLGVYLQQLSTRASIVIWFLGSLPAIAILVVVVSNTTTTSS